LRKEREREREREGGREGGRERDNQMFKKIIRDIEKNDRSPINQSEEFRRLEASGRLDKIRMKFCLNENLSHGVFANDE